MVFDGGRASADDRIYLGTARGAAIPTFYRVVKTDPPTERDFMSYEALGIPLRKDTPELRRSWEGVSVQDSPAAVRSLVRQFPNLGSFIATIVVPEDGPLHYEQTSRIRSHYDLHGTPGDMLATVVAVEPV